MQLQKRGQRILRSVVSLTVGALAILMVGVVSLACGGASKSSGAKRRPRMDRAALVALAVNKERAAKERVAALLEL